MFTILSYIYNLFIGIFSYYYLLILINTLLLFLLFRVPYCYSPYIFYTFLIVVVFRSFLSMFCRRLFRRVGGFFSAFIPVGTPLWICPLVCLAESVRYVIRPIVLILRPFINISLGCLGAVSLGKMCLVRGYGVFILFMVFLYELFVALVHWYIVARILSFSQDH